MLCQDLYHDPHVLETDPAITALATVQLSLGKTRWTGVWEGGGAIAWSQLQPVLWIRNDLFRIRIWIPL